MKNKLYFYFHAGSRNHGCEAIVRATQAMMENRPVLISDAPQEDLTYQLDRIVQIEKKADVQYTLLEKMACKLLAMVGREERFAYRLRARHAMVQYEPGGIALSIGGDNYCYGAAYNMYLEYLNLYLHRHGLKTVLWGCSIEPDMVTPQMERDFARYDLIAARESISYAYLKALNPNTVLVSDPAFGLKKEELPLPKAFVEGRTIGVNISPLIQKREQTPGVTMENYRRLISYILSQTDYHVALIPHVVCEGNDDRGPMNELYQVFEDTGRICMIDDCNCEQLKGYIARCAMFIGARTHATIAAYSTCVPTLTIGYSTKARGIARDLFGTEENYVLPVQQLSGTDDITKAFIWLEAHQEEIRAHLRRIMPDYVNRSYAGKEQLKQL